MTRTRMVLIWLLALAMLPAGLAARSAPRMPVAASAAIVSTAGTAVAEQGTPAQVTKRLRPCMRGVLPLAPCGADLALNGPSPEFADLGDEGSPSTGAIRVLAGLLPPCVLGPPRTC